MKVRRKFLVLVLFTLLSPIYAIKNVEFDAGVTGSFYDYFRGEESNSVQLGYPIGVQLSCGFILGSPATFFDIGINLGLDVGFGWEVKGKIFGVRNTLYDLIVSGDLSLGPVLCFNFGQKNSLYLLPSLVGGITGFKYMEQEAVSFIDDEKSNIKEKIKQDKKTGYIGDAAVGVEIGYKGWIKNSSYFSVGVMAGIKARWSLAGAMWLNDSWKDLQDGGCYKVYIGVCMCFGERGIRKQEAEE